MCESNPSAVVPNIRLLQQRFLAVLARIENHARLCFRYIRCASRRAECVAEAVAIAWKWFLRLAERGKDAATFPIVLAHFAARAVRSGRRVCGQERSGDVFSSTAQQRHGFTVGSIPDGSSLAGNVFDEALRDNMQTPVPEQVWFRLDFPRWRASFAERDRRLIDNLLVGERTQEVSRKFGVSPARVSQKRREYHQDWQRFHGELNSHVSQPQSV